MYPGGCLLQDYHNANAFCICRPPANVHPLVAYAAATSVLHVLRLGVTIGHAVSHFPLLGTGLHQ
jgi:hypothetical protein